MPGRLKARKSSAAVIRWGELLRILQSYYRQGTWRVPVLRARGADPFVVLVSTILSHQTRDEVTERTTARLLSKLPTPEAMAGAPLDQIRSLVREAGLAQAKANSLQLICRSIVGEYNGRVPDREADLLKLPGIGPKTAHAILVFGYEEPGIPVDTHILRVSRRLGAVHSVSIRRAQAELAKIVPRGCWSDLNPILVQHGMNLCSPRAPRCKDCPIEHWCEKIGVRPDAAKD